MTKPVADIDAARRWAADDPDERTRTDLLATIAAADDGDADAVAELADAFAGTLQFGTAGLRGRMGPGPNRMNSVVVARAAAGLARYLSERGGGAVVIGYDARHDSDLFARITAKVMRGHGIEAMVLPRPLPTPVLAFAIRQLGCAAGVMVTASHNPPQDNGYKVYLGDGAQIIPPTDAQISTHIEAVTGEGPVADLPTGDDWVTLDDSIYQAYVDRVASLVPADAPRHLRVVYTAMHGVGGDVMLSVLERAGFPEPVPVTEQFAPDPAFPTVAFPNPEEPGAMDLALATAARAAADVVIANDPDADRCAVAVPTSDGWRMLTGDETGSLLAWWIVHRAAHPERGTLAQSLVSSSLLRAIASDAGFDYAQTLTGFKWIARAPGLVFGYEEALGYCVDPTAVKDKDGISAALLIIELAALIKADGRRLTDVLDSIARTFGVYSTSQVSVRVTDLGRIDTIMAELRSKPPTRIAGAVVASFDDLQQGVDGLPPTDGLRFELESGARVIVRPSGTEPKVKCYLQAVVPPPFDDLAIARSQARSQLDAIAADVSAWLQ